MNCAGCASAKRPESMTLGAAIGAASTHPLATVALAANAAMDARRKTSLPIASSHHRCLYAKLRAFSGKVETGFPQNMPDVGRRSCLYGVGVVAHDCARVAIARNEDHIIDARERPLQS